MLYIDETVKQALREVRIACDALDKKVNYEELPWGPVRQGFEHQLSYLNEYGNSPAQWKVVISISKRNPLGMIGVVWYNRKTGINPADSQNSWNLFAEGGLVLHQSDMTWSVHT